MTTSFLLGSEEEVAESASQARTPSETEGSHAAALMRSAERYAGRSPAYAQDLRRAAQASLLLDTCCQF